MRHVDVPQGSAAWFFARMGKPTASEFDKLITPAKLQRSKSADPYMFRLLYEWATGQPFETDTTVWMSQGVTSEEKAVQYYELTTGRETTEAGFCLTDDGLAGASPDRFVGNDGLLEVKCPIGPTHIKYLLSGDLPQEYVMQVQGQLWVTGRQWVDFLSYYAGLPALLVRVLPDADYQDAFDTVLPEFCLDLERGKVQLQELGVVPVPPPDLEGMPDE